MNFNDFYLYKYWAQTPDQRYKPINTIDDVVVINFDPLFDRDYSLRAKDQLIFVAHKIGKDKRFLFIFEDGTNPQLSGAIEVIKNIQAVFNLSENDCAVIARERLAIPNVKCLYHDSITMWAQTLYPTIKQIPIYNPPYGKKFAAWFHRGTIYRAMIAKHLYNNYRDISYLSYQESKVLHDELFAEFFSDETQWANNCAPVVYDRLFPNRQYDHEMIVGASRKPYDDYFLEIVVETDIQSTAWITEKVVKNLYIGKPFILLGAPGSLRKLQQQGFKTFSSIIDESYDDIQNNYHRVQAVLKEIDKLAAGNVQELHNEILPILSHNRKIYENIARR